VHAADEDEVREAFVRVLPLRRKGAEVAALADRWFFETVVRVHRAGEHAVLGFEVYSNHVYQALHADPHGEHQHK